VKILVTGADGYIGATLTPLLLSHGHAVTGVDAGFYRSGWLYDDLAVRPRTLTRDIRSLEAADLAGFDAVVHLAELSNDPLGANDPAITFQINHQGTVALAQAAKRAGVRRFVYTSSCSVYGAGGGGILDETSPVNPQTAYAECKVLCERDLSALMDQGFAPTFLRNATAFGASPRMRFDIVLNNLAGLGWTTGQIAMTSDGSPWRPLVHVLDIARAITLTLDAPEDRIRGQVLNVGADAQNYRVREIAEIVADALPGCTTIFGPPGPDNRSYRVSFARIGQVLPGFQCGWTARRGARQLIALFRRIGMTQAVFEHPAFTRLRELKRLTGSGQLDAALRWRPLDLDGAADTPDAPALAEAV